MKNPILVTGAAGFIGFHTCLQLLKNNELIIGLDNINDYYDVNLKKDRLAQIKRHPNFSFKKIDLIDKEAIDALFKKYSFSTVIHLAAQAGVRYSLENPHSYINSNIVGFMNVLEACRHTKIEYLIYASSSSVYGNNINIPFSASQNVDRPVSLYAATKKSNELMAHCYSHLYRIPSVGLRFFTVYGPWGRPDMSPILFAKAISENRPIDVFNYGNMERDFTYIDDVVESILRLLKRGPGSLPSNKNHVPYKIYNIGNDRPIKLHYMIELLEKRLGKKAKKNLIPMQEGDVQRTWADIDDLKRDILFSPKISIEEGIEKFVAWYLEYYETQSAVIN